MRAGQLRHLLTLQELTAGQDAIGQPVQAWADVAEDWADVRFLRGIEAVKAGASVSVADCSIRVRYRAGVTAGMRYVEGATVYDIQSVLPDTTGMRYLDLACKQGASGG
jgi:SPP1 family predicted phage head-tail adaptor